ncbi:unnamed protein product [Microthlaspi erraticum]|uniref:U-box domain-containing protein n=1 Tax=Microthlaspi erraticum TaxID=1685480 RepID=A0A6D2IF72_9BRAS|nr:unnamed protein product [Microthlaspi erraticum]CAA7039526.1 unnamed protein product [Microthlaspi erraticum]
MRRRGGSKKELIPVMGTSEEEEEITIPSQFQCPISYELMKDPVIIASGITYDRESIDTWFESGNRTCPVTNTVLTTSEQIPNHAIRRMIQGWCVANKGSSSLDRIPTPRVPITSHQVVEIREKLSSATRRGDHVSCVEMVKKMKRLGKESERNKKCLSENGVGFVLCVCFDAFSENASNVTTVLLEDVLLLLTWMFPIGLESQGKLTTTASFKCLLSFLRRGDQNAAFLVKELLSFDEANVHALVAINGVEEAFVKSIRDSVSLTSIYRMISVKPETISRFLELGLVNLTVEMLVDSENSVCEKALLVLDAICEREEGRREVRGNELVMPILVKKILKISESAKKSLVSVMWKVCKTGDGSEVEDALRLGAFKKLVVVLQVGCGDGTKEKVTELLKMMNKQMKMIGFVDRSDSSIEFRHLKKPF